MMVDISNKYIFFLTGTCPDGFIEHKRRCYGFFINNYDKSTWGEAQKRCRFFNGGDLLSIFTEEENVFVTKKFSELNPDLKEKEHYYPWIGLYLRKRRNRSTF